MGTIPPGIGIPAAGRSAGDIDEVARLYGQVSKQLTISSNPPGLEIPVDNVPYSTPVSLEWPDRSIRPIEPPVSAVKGGLRYLFGLEYRREPLALRDRRPAAVREGL